MNIILNGTPYDTQALTFAELAAELNIPVDRTVVLHNDQPLAKEQWETTLLVSADQLELLEFVGGG